ncbi:hypothetical protein EV44_g4970 [Erysiphe necator]|uniref:Uncharacterized protein n=1 Tax=Uncinula necator TaxID=52586 RepID=A0A0B1P4C0_UNCNE|nr:hypothetical protein EV44_g4970 [Erysiphe necator]
MSDSGPSSKRAHSPSSDYERNVEFETLVELKDILTGDLNRLRENIERLNKVWIEAVEKNMPEEKCSHYFDKFETAELRYEDKISQLKDVVQQISKLRIEGLSAKKAKIQTAVPFAKVELSHLQTMGIDIDIYGREFELPGEKQKLEPSKWLLETLGLLQKHWTTLKEAGRRTYIDAIILASIDHATRGLEEERMDKEWDTGAWKRRLLGRV